MIGTKQGRHQAPTDKATKARRKLAGIPIFGWLTFAGAGVALAAWLVITGVSGSVTTATFDSYWTGGAPLVAGDCTATVVNGTKDMAITWTNAVGGDTCQITTAAEGPPSNSIDIRAQAFDLTSPGSTGVLASLGATCGATIPAGGGGATVVFTLTVDEATTNPGDSFTFDYTLDGLKWVPASNYNAAACS